VVSDNRCSLRATCKAAAEFFGDLPKQQLESFHFITTAEVLTLLSRKFTAQTGDVCFLFEALCGAIDLAVMQPPANFYSIQHVDWRMAEPFLTVSTLSPLHTLRICSFFILSSMLAGGWQNLF
jgi:hypothetical protein